MAPRLLGPLTPPWLSASTVHYTGNLPDRYTIHEYRCGRYLRDGANSSFNGRERIYAPSSEKTQPTKSHVELMRGGPARHKERWVPKEPQFNGAQSQRSPPLNDTLLCPSVTTPPRAGGQSRPAPAGSFGLNRGGPGLPGRFYTPNNVSKYCSPPSHTIVTTRASGCFR